MSIIIRNENALKKMEVATDSKYVLELLMYIEHDALACNCTKILNAAFEKVKDLLAKENVKLIQELEQERVKSAGVLVALEGHATGNNDCNPGDYGWSLAFQKAKELKIEVEGLKRQLSENRGITV